MPELSPELRTLQARYAANMSWFNTPDRTARTNNARQAFEAKFLEEAEGDPLRAESLRKAYYAELALKSVRARRRRSGIRKGEVLTGSASSRRLSFSHVW
jgi:hypothetical protein